MRRRIFLLIGVAIAIALLSSTFLNSLVPAPKCTPDQCALKKALTYFYTYYNFRVGLVPEVPDGSTYWLYSDNYLASLALYRYPWQNQTTTALANAITGVMIVDTATLLPSQLQSQYTALNSTEASFACANDYTLQWVSPTAGSQKAPPDVILNTTANDGNGICGTKNYVDLLLLRSVHDHRIGDFKGAQSSYNQSTADFDGVGFTDVSTRNGQPYQTFKVALYIYATICDGYTTASMHLAAAEGILRQLQSNSTGGFETGYEVTGASHGEVPLVAGTANVNTETTALAMLALELMLNPNSAC